MIKTEFLGRLGGVVALLGTLSAVAVAGAATPDSGTVGPGPSKVTWTGTLTSSGVYYLAWEDDPELECQQQTQTCDKFSLKVEGGGQDLVLGLAIADTAAQGNEGGGGIRVKLPDGSYQYTSGTSGPQTTLKVKIRAAKAGDYEITTVASYVCCGSTDYSAYAEYGSAAAAPPPTPGAGPAPGTGGDGGGDTRPATAISVKAPKKASARKLKKSKKLAVALKSTGPVSDLTATLKRGKVQFGTGSLASLNGSGKITLRFAKKAVRKLKAGKYSFAVSGRDEQGRTVATGLSFKVKR